MRKRLVIICLIFSIFMIGCFNNDDALKFKKDYESLNGKINSKGYSYRDLSISKSNPFVYSTASDIVDRIENKETFFVYFGSALCPWCRSVIEKCISVANKYGIKKIYYVDIWDNEGNEILRDKYILEDENIVLANSGTNEYFTLLKYFYNLLPDYIYAANKNGGSKLEIDEKRIYVPMFILVENGKAVKMTSGISDIQTGSREELTDKILVDEENLFKEFFTDACDSSC